MFYFNLKRDDGGSETWGGGCISLSELHYTSIEKYNTPLMHVRRAAIIMPNSYTHKFQEVLYSNMQLVQA